MFDLNELPDNEGPAGRASLSMLYPSAAAGRAARGGAGKAEECDDDDDDVVVVRGVEEDDDDDEDEDDEEEEEEVEGEEEQQVFYTSGDSTKIICRLLRDEAATAAAAKVAPQSFLRLDSSSSSMRYSNNWQPLGLASFDETEIDTDNEVTVAALDARAILDSQCVTGLDSAVSLVVPTEPGPNFGISPRPEKLGQRIESVRKRPDFTNFQRSAGKWDGFVSEKRGGKRVEDDLSLDSPESSLYPGILSSRKGKRAREEGSHANADALIKLKRHARPTPTLANPQAYHGAGPSLSMSFDQDATAPAKNSSFSTAYKMPSSKGEGLERDGATALSLNKSSIIPFDSAVVQRAGVHTAGSLKSNFGLSMTVGTIAKTVDSARDNLDSVSYPDEDRAGEEIGADVKGLDGKLPAGAVQPFGAEKPFWQGKLCVRGFSTSDVAAYCSDDLQPSSKLWSLPQVMTVEKAVKIEEFLAAVRGVNVVEPLIRLRLVPDAANNGQSFRSMVTSLNIKKKGRAKDRSSGPEMQLAWQKGSHAWRNGSSASAGDDYVFVASLELKEPEEALGNISAELYLLLDSSCEAVSNVDREFGRKLLEELEWSCPPEGDLLFGFLCLREEADVLAESSRDSEGKAEVSRAGIEVSTVRGIAPVILPGAPLDAVEVVVNSADMKDRLEKLDPVQRKLQSEDVDVLARAENEERTVTDGIYTPKSKDQKDHSLDSSHEIRRVDKVRGRKDVHGLRYNNSAMEDEGHKDRDRHRDRDRDLRGREKDKDVRNSSKDFHRYSYRSNEKGDLAKRDREVERFRERSHRDSHRDLTDRPKSSRERMKEQEKHKERHRDREKEKEKERPFRKRDRSAEPEKSTPDDNKVTPEPDKAVSGVKEGSRDHLLQQFGKEEIRKRIRIESQDTPADGTAAKAVPTENEVTKPSDVGVDVIAESVGALPPHNSTQAEGAGQGEASAQVTDTMMLESSIRAEDGASEGKSMDIERDVQVDTEPVDPDERTKEQAGTPSSTIPAHSFKGTGRTLAADIELRVSGRENSLVAEASDTARASDAGSKSVKETEELRLQEGEDTSVVKDTHEKGRSHSRENLIHNTKDGEQRENQSKNSRIGLVEIQGNVGEVVKAEVTGVAEPSYDPKEERLSDAEMLDDVQERKPRSALSVRVDNMYYAVEGQRSDDSEGKQGLEEAMSRFLKSANATPSTDKTTISGADDLQGSLMTMESPSSTVANGLVSPSFDLSAEVSCEILLEGCDKETRAWLVSKQNESYLSEEFGVRIARLEEVVNPKSDARMKNQQGLLNVRVFLATEKSADSNEARWFTNQSADVLRALASRGVFAKCLWYQGPVHRFAGDPAPSIQVIVRKIKGEDGRNLERIQEETGVMIGIVLDAINKKGIVNSSRVIGLRLKCARKKGFHEATKQVENLLSQVAELFSKNARAKLAGSQDVALLKLKVDFSNSTSPSSGIPTPMPKDVFAAYSPVSPVAGLSPLGSFKTKMDEPSSEAAYPASLIRATTPLLPDSTLNVNPAPPPLLEFASQSQQSEDEQLNNGLSIPDPEAKSPRPLFVSNLPERFTASMLRNLFEDVLKEKFGLPSTYDGVSDMILDVRFAPDKFCAVVEFASDELLLEVLKIYADNRPAFFGLNLEMGSSASLKKLERMFLAAPTETTSKVLEYVGDIVDSPTFLKPRSGRKFPKSDDHPVRVAATLRSSPESETEVITQDRRFGGRDGAVRYLHAGEKPKPLFLTELMRNASARSIHTLFEDLIKKYVKPPLGKFKGRATVLDVRYIPSRGCAFVDLATPELVDFMLELHTRKPEVFHHMKMEIGRRPVPLGQGEEEPVVKRSSHLGRNALVEESHSYGSGRRNRGYFHSTSPPRGNELAVMDNDLMDDYEEEEDEERQPSTSRKRRSDPERTVYADRLPDNASEGMIRRIFERVLRDNMTDEQREVLGDQIITEVRYVPSKFCAFVVFVAEELTRLVLQLYNQDEEIFKNMRLKPHFHSRMEDLYRDDLHDPDERPAPRVLSKEKSMDRRGRRGMEDFQNGYSAADISDFGYRGKNSSAHRAVAATAFKEVDRRRSVYVDRISERLPEPTMREVFERALRSHRHGYSSRMVSQVTFFRDKFDPDKLCAFVELDNEDLVQELLDVYMEDEEAFSGMRVRPAVKYGN